MNNNFIKIQAGDTKIWERPEKNLIYLISEFIDNSKASYEEIILEKKDIDLDELPINISFNAKDGFICIQDFAKGFDIVKALKNVGSDSIKTGKTNQYYVGMKSAMNYFGDFAIIISEQKIDGKFIKKANVFIYKNDIFENSIELIPDEKVGSSVILFSRENNAKVFWRQLKFINKSDSDLFDNFNLDESEFLTYSITESFLDNLRDSFKALSESLFHRYTPLVNEFTKIKINFDVIDKNGIKINDPEKPSIFQNKNIFPEFFWKIRENNWEQKYAFSFEEFVKSDLNKLFVEKISDNYFINELEKMLYKEVKSQFSKIKKDFAVGEIAKEEVGELPQNIEWVDFEDDNEYKLLEKNWDKYPFAKKFVAKFLSNLKTGKNTLSSMKFIIPNLIIDEDRNVITSKFHDPKEIFNLSFEFNIFSRKFSLNNNEYGDISNKLITGFSLVQNNRAIYHGPNVYRNSNKTKSPIFSNKIPANLLVKKFTEGNTEMFPNVSNKNSGTYVKVGGNNDKPSSRLFGKVYIPNDSSFKPGTNKSQIQNEYILEEYISKIIRDSGINVLIRWVHCFDNQDLNTLEPKKKEKTILIAALENLEKTQLKEESLINSNKISNLDFFEEKNSSYKQSFKSTMQELKKDYVPLNEAFLDLNDFSRKEILDFIYKKVIFEKRNPLQITGIDSLEIVDDYICLKLKSEAFKKWKNQILINIITDEKQEIVDFKLEDNVPIFANIHLKINQNLNSNEPKEEQNAKKQFVKNKSVQIIFEILKIINYSIGYFKVNETSKTKHDDEEMNKNIEDFIRIRFYKLENSLNNKLSNKD